MQGWLGTGDGGRVPAWLGKIQQGKLQEPVSAGLAADVTGKAQLTPEREKEAGIGREQKRPETEDIGTRQKRMIRVESRNRFS